MNSTSLNSTSLDEESQNRLRMLESWFVGGGPIVPGRQRRCRRRRRYRTPQTRPGISRYHASNPLPPHRRHCHGWDPRSLLPQQDPRPGSVRQSVRPYPAILLTRRLLLRVLCASVFYQRSETQRHGGHRGGDRQQVTARSAAVPRERPRPARTRRRRIADVVPDSAGRLTAGRKEDRRASGHTGWSPWAGRHGSRAR